MRHTITLTPGKIYDIKITIDGSCDSLPSQGDVVFIRREFSALIEAFDSKTTSQITIDLPDGLSPELLELQKQWLVKDLIVTYDPKPSWWELNNDQKNQT